MDAHFKLSAGLLFAGIALAGSAFAQERVEVTTVRIDPGYGDSASPPVHYSVSPEYYVSRESVITEPSVTVVAPNQDQIDDEITYDVAHTIASDPRPWHGTVGIDTHDSDVTLNGLVSTPGQAARAAQDARGVDGVRNVDNQIRSRVGGSY